MGEHSQQVLTELTRQGLKARFVARPDACPACRKLHGRVFEPLEAPPIPIRDCLTPPCRCRYEGCDPRSTVESLLTAGIAAVNEQRLEEARELLYQVIDLDERNEMAWLWLSEAAEGIDERIRCLETVLAINPRHEVAQQGLNHLLGEPAQDGSGHAEAGEIRVARDAIEHIRSSQDKIITLKEKLPVTITPAEADMRREHIARGPPKRQRARMQCLVMAFLYVLLAVLIFVLVWVALTYARVL